MADGLRVTAGTAADRPSRGGGTLDAETRRVLQLEPEGSQMEEMSEDSSGVAPDRRAGDSLPDQPPSPVNNDGGPPTAEVPVTVLLGDSPATGAEPASEAAEDASSVGAKRRRLPAMNLWSAVAALVIAALAAGLIVSLLDIGQKNSADSARTSALKAASSYAVEIGSYNYRHLQQDFNLVKSHSTPSFRTSFSQSSSALSSILSKYHATAAGTVAAAGVVSASPTQAVVIVFLNQKVTNTAKAGGASTDHLRLEMTLDNSNGHWLIDKVKLL